MSSEYLLSKSKPHKIRTFIGLSPKHDNSWIMILSLELFYLNFTGFALSAKCLFEPVLLLAPDVCFYRKTTLAYVTLVDFQFSLFNEIT